MRKERLFSIARKLVILALVASALLLLFQTDYFSALRRTLPAEAPARADSTSVEGAAALRPRAVMVCYADGSRAASACDGEATEEAFLHFAALLGEALGSAGAPQEIEEAEFRALAEAGSVFVDLGAPIQLDLLTGWLGAGVFAESDRSADILYLGLSEEDVLLCFRGADGGFYRCDTVAQGEALRARMGDLLLSGDAAFAYENARLEGVEPYMVILEETPDVPAVSAASARDEAAPEALLEAVGMNFFVASYYDEADGTAVYVEEEKTLRLSPDGVLSYRDGGAIEDASRQGSLSDAVYRAFLLARGSAGAYCGDARLMFAGAEWSGGGACTVYFDYCVNGIPVRLAEGHAATVEIAGGELLRATVALRRYSASGEAETVLPMYRAAAIAAADGGGSPALIYADSGTAVKCIWINE